jgi:hypothetical protein
MARRTGFALGAGLCLICLALVGCTLVSSGSASESTLPVQATPQSSPVVSLDPRLKAALPALQEVSIPVRLPPSLEAFSALTQEPLYVTVINATADDYDLAITLMADCQAHACMVGHLIGKKVTSAGDQGTPVPLTGGVTASYVPPVCGANCSDAELGWVENGIRYAVTARGEDVDLLKAVATAMLSTTPIDVHNLPG